MRCSLLALVVIVCMAGVAASAETEARPLFDGKSFDGWKILGCEAEIQDGAMLMKAGNGVVRTDRKYANYVLAFEWKALKAENYDSGVYFRCDDPPAGAPWPTMYQANLRQGMEGNVQELKEARSKGLVQAGQWNRFQLTVDGPRCELEINGKPAWKAAGLKNSTGYISLQAEIPGGGQFLFRNITIRELP